MSRVVLLAPTPPPIGGIAAWTQRMRNAQLPHGWEVGVVDEKILGKREFFGDNVKYDVKLEIKRCIGIWKNLWRELRDKNTQVVHSCIPANTLPVVREIICALITKICRRKFVVHFRCTVPNMVHSRINKIVLKLICKLSDCIIVLNNPSRDFILSLTGKKSLLIPNFVDASEIADEHTIREVVQEITYVGGVIEEKGCIEIIEVAKHFPEILFRLIGNAEQKCAKSAEKVSNVILEGAKSHEEIRLYMDKADIFIFLSFMNGEGFSNSLAEAMASGLPCIVSDWAANKDMIENKGGIVVPVHGVKEVIKAIDAMKSPSLRKDESCFNINKCRTHYSDEVILKQYVECYEGLTHQ